MSKSSRIFPKLKDQRPDASWKWRQGLSQYLRAETLLLQHYDYFRLLSLDKRTLQRRSDQLSKRVREFVGYQNELSQEDHAKKAAESLDQALASMRSERDVIRVTLEALEHPGARQLIRMCFTASPFVLDAYLACVIDWLKAQPKPNYDGLRRYLDADWINIVKDIKDLDLLSTPDKPPLRLLPQVPNCDGNATQSTAWIHELEKGIWYRLAKRYRKRKLSAQDRARILAKDLYPKFVHELEGTLRGISLQIRDISEPFLQALEQKKKEGKLSEPLSS